MCQHILQFCSGSTKPLLFVGGFLTFLLAVAIGYIGYTTNSLYNDIDPKIAAARSLSFYLQIGADAYLSLVAVFSCYAAYYDQKHSIRALSGIATVNFVLALAAILLIPSGQELSQPFQDTLKQAAGRYNFSDKGSPANSTSLSAANFPVNVAALTATNASSPEAATPEPSSKVTTHGASQDEVATKIWDNLQARGCCGITNGKTDWPKMIPKSCCANPENNDQSYVCKSIDEQHQLGCLTLIGSTSLNLQILLALIALVNFYLALISGINAYKTYSYSEASQNAYT